SGAVATSRAPAAIKLRTSAVILARTRILSIVSTARRNAAHNLITQRSLIQLQPLIRTSDHSTRILRGTFQRVFERPAPRKLHHADCEPARPGCPRGGPRDAAEAVRAMTRCS